MGKWNDAGRCLCGDCCGCSGESHPKGFCPLAKCSKFKAKENVLDIMAEIDAIGDGDKSHLQARVEKMESEIVEGNNLSRYVQPLSAEDMAEQQRSERDQQVEAAARGERPNLSGDKSPRISDFYLVDTTMTPEAFMKVLNEEVLGHYDVQAEQGAAEFGMIVLRHTQGLPQPGAALPADANGFGPSPLANVRPMLIVKLDAGAWAWYDAASMAIIAGIVRRIGRRAWRCAWAIDKQWSWVEHWRVDKNTHDGKITETIDGPANETVTAKASARWNINVRSAFDDLMRAAQWETLRQWLLCGDMSKPESFPDTAAPFVSLLAGRLMITKSDHEWILKGWSEKFPGRKPEDGPLHLQAYYVPTQKSRPIPEKEKVQSFRTEPPLLSP